MKVIFMKICPVLASLALLPFAGWAQAQSTVEIFGVIDLAYRHTSADGTESVNSLSPGGNTTNRFGFKGTEDLGGGLKVGFWLEGAVSPDTGLGGTASTDNKSAPVSAFFGRRATVSLAGAWGQVRLGRDLVPSFFNLTASMHPFGTNGVGNSGQLFYPVNVKGGTTVRTSVRASNSIGYLLPPKLGGFYGHAMYAMGEQASGTATSDDGNYIGARLGYRAGPLNLAASTGTTKYIKGDYTQRNFAINYLIGPVKLMYLWGRNKVGVTQTTSNMLGTQWKIGKGEIRFAYTTLKADAIANDASQWAIGYVHDLSKRTALYANYSQVSNDGAGTQFKVGGGENVVAAGGGSTGYEFGIRHKF